MKRLSQILLAGAGTLALAACGSADDASADAEADTVEMPADAALAGVNEEPVADAGAEDESAAVAEEAETAGDAGADVAAAAEAALGDAGDAGDAAKGE